MPNATPPFPSPRLAQERGNQVNWSSLPQAERFHLPTPKAWLGVASETAEGGIVLLGIAPHSPAKQADLRVGDILIAVNRQAIASPNALVQALRLMRPGDLVEIAFIRGGRTLMSQVQLQKAPVGP